MRELRNLVERAVILSSGDAHRPRLHRDLRAQPGAPAAATGPAFFCGRASTPAGKPPDLDGARAGLHRPAAGVHGRQPDGQVARLLGVSYPTVAKKIADYGLA